MSPFLIMSLNRRRFKIRPPVPTAHKRPNFCIMDGLLSPLQGMEPTVFRP